MLVQFLVENYGPIKKECILSMEPSADKEHPENVNTDGKHSVLNLAAIYGANASGKTFLFRALTSGINIIRSSNARQVNDRLPVVPYLFDEETQKKPTHLEYTFIASDHRKYIYGFLATQTEIIEEYLYCYYSAKRSMIFERTREHYVYSRRDKAELQPTEKMNTPNKLLLATATAWNAIPTLAAFRWFAEGIETFTNDENIISHGLDRYSENTKTYVDFTKEMLRQADINISEIYVETKKKNNSGQMINGLIVDGQLIQPEEMYDVSVKTGHIVKTEDNQVKRYLLPFEAESLGTKQLFYMAPLFRDALEKGLTLVIDEIDRSMHPFIVKYLVNLFRNKNVNVNNAQLIFTTHATTLLTLSVFRRDQIWFTEKNNETGVTDLYSLGDYSVKKTENIEKGYLIGRYGAIPYLQTEEIV